MIILLILALLFAAVSFFVESRLHKKEIDELKSFSDKLGDVVKADTARQAAETAALQAISTRLEANELCLQDFITDSFRAFNKMQEKLDIAAESKTQNTSAKSKKQKKGSAEEPPEKP